MGWYKGMTHTKETKEKISNSMNVYKRQIYQYDTNYKLIAIHESFKSLYKKGFNIGGIWQVCNNRRSSYMGYIWSYTPLHDVRFKECRNDYTDLEVAYWKCMALIDNGWTICMTSHEISNQFLVDKEKQLEELFKENNLSGINKLIDELKYLDDVDIEDYLTHYL